MGSLTRGSSLRRAVPARWRQLDWWLVGAALALAVLGCVMVWSATQHRAEITGGDPRAFLDKQIVNLVLALCLGGLVLAVDHRWVRIFAPLAYLAVVVGLVLVLTMGSTINGSRSWLMLGGLSLQPSELAKLAVVVGMALVVAERSEWSLGATSRSRPGSAPTGRRDGGPGVLVLMLAVAAVPSVLILAQPDLGTMLVLSATVVGVLAVAGVARRWLVLLGLGGVAVAAFAVTSGFLKQYQIDRFLAFTDPTLDPRGAGYNVEQARIAIGNGGLLGQGLFEGSQTRAGFVPEQHTDFVFTVIGEELGLVGALLVVALLAVVLWRALSIATHAEDVFGRVAAAGIACWLGFQSFQNIGMCLGIMPVTGVPLPFVSYGGSSLFACMIAVGLLQNIHLRSASAPAARLQPSRGVLARSR
ncbi:rod shape-determining protein RodA [Nocardioides panacisoli]|uniref:rod shape-determining protein RodA n=1 Tax=Nocardioides panacisoli TaxID=627624 RepID=UPI001C6336C0|nr:rod shape-determining protein RodA [Nocardioides panacisoli]QYJ04427.1 rod shape-determining protein RodA [Nocardioides panacisoli]